MWAQDFPFKSRDSPTSSAFEEDLSTYISIAISISTITTTITTIILSSSHSDSIREKGSTSDQPIVDLDLSPYDFSSATVTRTISPTIVEMAMCLRLVMVVARWRRCDEVTRTVFCRCHLLVLSLEHILVRQFESISCHYHCHHTVLVEHRKSSGNVRPYAFETSATERETIAKVQLKTSNHAGTVETCVYHVSWPLSLSPSPSQLYPSCRCRVLDLTRIKRIGFAMSCV